jgi:hypothetical protein
MRCRRDDGDPRGLSYGCRAADGSTGAHWSILEHTCTALADEMRVWGGEASGGTRDDGCGGVGGADVRHALRVRSQPCSGVGARASTCQSWQHGVMLMGVRVERLLVMRGRPETLLCASSFLLPWLGGLFSCSLHSVTLLSLGRGGMAAALVRIRGPTEIFGHVNAADL